MRTVNELYLDYIDKTAERDDLEDLVAEIKSIIESPFTGDEYKVKEIRKAIIDADY